MIANLNLNFIINNHFVTSLNFLSSLKLLHNPQARFHNIYFQLTINWKSYQLYGKIFIHYWQGQVAVGNINWSGMIFKINKSVSKSWAVKLLLSILTLCVFRVQKNKINLMVALALWLLIILYLEQTISWFVNSV